MFTTKAKLHIPGYVARTIDIIQSYTEKPVYLVGGCVRDHLLKIIPKDYDIASALPPEEIIRAFKHNPNFHIIKTGIEHGTVTIHHALTGDSMEHTTFRKDVSTDGRRATVAYATTIEEDHLRRDFTFNACYYDDYSETITGPDTAMDDLNNRIIRFVGNAEDRIKEDYLRIMRYFRFAIKYDMFMLPEDLEVIRKNIEGLSQVSMERITSELLQILSYHNQRVMRAMTVAGVFRVIGLPLPSESIIYTRSSNATSGIHRLAMLTQSWYGRNNVFPPPLNYVELKDKFKLSKNQLKELNHWHDADDFLMYIPWDKNERVIAYELMDVRKLHEKILWILRNVPNFNIPWKYDNVYETVVHLKNNKFPVTGDDLKKIGITGGMSMGAKLFGLRIMWIKSDFKMTKEDLLNHIKGLQKHQLEMINIR